MVSKLFDVLVWVVAQIVYPFSLRYFELFVSNKYFPDWEESSVNKEDSSVMFTGSSDAWLFFSSIG